MFVPSMEMIFIAGTMDGATACIDVSIIDDPFVEGPETFGILLELETTDLGVTLGDAMTVVSIVDNEGS